jgi:hypothetical protein
MSHDWYPRRMSFGYAVIDPHMEADLLEGLCEGYVRANQIQILADPDAYPCCIGCGKYRYIPPKNCRIWHWRTGREVDPNCQHVHGAYPLDRRKMGTCIDLACMLAAIYRVKEGDPGARVLIDHQIDDEGNGIPGKYHALVRLGNGEIIDPIEKAYKPDDPGQSIGAVNEPPKCNCAIGGQ